MGARPLPPAAFVAVAAPALLLFSPVDARADGMGATINPGAIVSGVAGPAPAWGIGGELSFMLFPGSKILKTIGYGALGQYQRYNLDHDRYAFALQASYLFAGAELGYAYRSVSPDHSGLHGVHVAIYGSIGFAVLTLRGTVPLVAAAEDALHPSPGYEVAVSLSLKVPIPIHITDKLVYDGASGRALRDRGRVVVAEAVPGNGFARGPVPDVARLGARDRRRLSRKWLADGLLEHASVAAFLRLAAELSSLGAPRDLVSRALRAARQEVRHARLCFSVASAYAGVELAPGPLPVLAHRAPDLGVIAEESRVDGCLGEGAAARAALLARDRENDDALRAVLAVIARDESAHARLAEDVLAYTAQRGVRCGAGSSATATKALSCRATARAAT